MSEAGHNSDGRLQSFIERIERLENEKHAVAEDIKEVYAEAKGTGYDVKIMRRIVRYRCEDSERRREEDELLAAYLDALGMVGEIGDRRIYRTR